jgi:hypothetical protein
LNFGQISENIDDDGLQILNQLKLDSIRSNQVNEYRMPVICQKRFLHNISYFIVKYSLIILRTYRSTELKRHRVARKLGDSKQLQIGVSEVGGKYINLHYSFVNYSDNHVKSHPKLSNGLGLSFCLVHVYAHLYAPETETSQKKSDSTRLDTYFKKTLLDWVWSLIDSTRLKIEMIEGIIFFK